MHFDSLLPGTNLYPVRSIVVPDALYSSTNSFPLSFPGGFDSNSLIMSPVFRGTLYLSWTPISKLPLTPGIGRGMFLSIGPTAGMSDTLVSTTSYCIISGIVAVNPTPLIFPVALRIFLLNFINGSMVILTIQSFDTISPFPLNISPVFLLCFNSTPALIEVSPRSAFMVSLHNDFVALVSVAALNSAVRDIPQYAIVND